MTDIATLCAQVGLDEAAVRRVLESERGAADAVEPWYVLLLLGLGAWITALIMVVFVAVLLNVAFDVEKPNLASAAIGAGMFLCGLFIEAKGKASVFAQQFAIALVAAGAAIVAVSLWVEADSAWDAAAAAAAMTAIDVWRGRNAQQQFLLAALAVGLAIAAIDDATTAGRIDIVALALPIGVALYLRPPRVDMRPTATALLLAMPFHAVVTDSLYAPSLGFDNWPARAIALAVVLALTWLRTRGPATPPDHLRRLLVAVAAAVVCLLLPPGGSAGLAILMLAFTLGHWPLAIVGALLEVYFVPRFYYYLELSLLTKSWILVAVGVALLASYATLRPRGRVRS
jgi:Domain of unknown function (DUF4401)